MAIKDWPADERPREKLLQSGAAAFLRPGRGSGAAGTEHSAPARAPAAAVRGAGSGDRQLERGGRPPEHRRGEARRAGSGFRVDAPGRRAR